MGSKVLLIKITKGSIKGPQKAGRLRVHGGELHLPQGFSGSHLTSIATRGGDVAKSRGGRAPARP